MKSKYIEYELLWIWVVRNILNLWSISTFIRSTDYSRLCRPVRDIKYSGYSRLRIGSWISQRNEPSSGRKTCRVKRPGQSYDNMFTRELYLSTNICLANMCNRFKTGIAKWYSLIKSGVRYRLVTRFSLTSFPPTQKSFSWTIWSR